MESHQSDQEKKAAKPQMEDFIELTDSGEVDPENDEEIIDLTDIVDPLSTEPAGPEKDLPEFSDPPEAGSQDAPLVLAGLTDELPGPSEPVLDREENPFLKNLSFDDAMEEELSLETGHEDDFIESLGMELDGKGGLEMGPGELSRVSPETGQNDNTTMITGDISVTPAQIDAAVERVIVRMFYDKIETALTDAVGNVVKREIEKLKKLLDDEGIEEEK